VNFSHLWLGSCDSWPIPTMQINIYIARYQSSHQKTFIIIPKNVLFLVNNTNTNIIKKALKNNFCVYFPKLAPYTEIGNSMYHVIPDLSRDLRNIDTYFLFVCIYLQKKQLQYKSNKN
jgi:hypothetical protein